MFSMSGDIYKYVTQLKYINKNNSQIETKTNVRDAGPKFRDFFLQWNEVFD